jgi:hypothetical protein
VVIAVRGLILNVAGVEVALPQVPFITQRYLLPDWLNVIDERISDELVALLIDDQFTPPSVLTCH